MATLAGCGDTPVPIDSPRLSPADLAACEAFLDAVPDELAAESSRLVSPAAALGAAWGDPPIVATCGVGLPGDFDRFAQCVEANGVGWFVPDDEADDPSSDATLTTAGYRPIVQVRVPATYRTEGASASVMAQLASAVEDHLELVESCE